tara:strand:- start:312 stop:674 length:363 start_codon:yes stop_codon:yes gene_type:complete
MRTIFLILLTLISLNGSPFVVSKMDLSEWDNGVGIFWITDTEDTYKVLVFRDYHSFDQLPSIGDTVDWNLVNYSFPKNTISSDGDSILWHPGSHWPKCWSNTQIKICPDTDSSYLYMLER